MAFRTFDSPQLSRRELFRAGGYLAAGSALATMPFGRALLAHDVSESWPNVASTIGSYVESGKVANMLVSFGWKAQDPHTVSRGTLSFNNKAEAGLDSLYRIYSMTKPITGMAVMMLIEDGKLRLDQPLAEILPAFAEMRVLKRPDGPLDDTVPAERPITIRQLLTHTAGLGYDITSKGPLLEAYRGAGITSGQVSRLPIPGLPQVASAPGLKAFADRLAKLPLAYQPATRWSYSASIDLLGRVIEVASGQGFAEFLQQRMFDPCGMTSTYWQVPASETKRLTDNYGILAGMPLPMDPAGASIYLDKPPLIWGGSGLVCSPRDYDRFLKMLLGYGVIDGKRVITEAAVKQGTSNILPESVSTKGTWLAGEGFGAGGRSKGQQYGWSGAAGTIGAVDFGLGLRAALFTQYMPSEAYKVRDEFLSALEKDLSGMRRAAA
ncbi:beta-lactamase family protein [Altererythrobacter sp. BO-6]|uniref:serine hydrolase domain-containing protein n=1 Tax=Altererythrobacter sp. BO-6 TaxID=2604537 RepID=UPI0013E195F6|nr:serine hydrolase domain-containing protein [Altererythrobacter sp. BO-6]QIG55040.1 beta-lactamase family protein [Altererythrobacter sp. BO-6]